MPTSYTWTAELECIDEGELVNVARIMNWRCTGVLDGLDMAACGSKALGEPSPDNFVPAPDDITSTVVREWVGDELADEVEATLAAALAAQVVEPEVTRFIVPVE
jgi:hypothetical protein